MFRRLTVFLQGVAAEPRRNLIRCSLHSQIRDAKFMVEDPNNSGKWVCLRPCSPLLVCSAHPGSKRPQSFMVEDKSNPGSWSCIAESPCWRNSQKTSPPPPSPVRETVPTITPPPERKVVSKLYCVKHFMYTFPIRGRVLPSGDFECSPATPCAFKSENYKVAMCERHAEGKCTYGASCVRAHDKSELRARIHRCQKHGEWRSVAHLHPEERVCNEDSPCRQNHETYRTKECPLFKKDGTCPLGLDCFYIHQAPEKEAIPVTKDEEPSRLPRKVSSKKKYCDIHFQFRWPKDVSQQEDGTFHCNEATPCTLDPASFKTALCARFEVSGRCKNGDKCSRAHGSKELRLRTDQARCTKHGRWKAISELAEGTQHCSDATPCKFSEDEKYKRKLCQFYDPASGRECSHGSNCFHAHGEMELRKIVQAPPEKIRWTCECGTTNEGILRRARCVKCNLTPRESRHMRWLADQRKLRQMKSSGIDEEQ